MANERKREFIVLCASIVGNMKDGFETVYGSDCERFSDRQAAIDHGFTFDRSDDFNVGVVEDGKLVSVDWMHKPVDTEPALMRAIEAKIHL